MTDTMTDETKPDRPDVEGLRVAASPHSAWATPNDLANARRVLSLCAYIDRLEAERDALREALDDALPLAQGADCECSGDGRTCEPCQRWNKLCALLRRTR